MCDYDRSGYTNVQTKRLDDPYGNDQCTIIDGLDTKCAILWDTYALTSLLLDKSPVIAEVNARR